MKHRIAYGSRCFFLALASLAAGCATRPDSADPWFGRDKAKHFCAAAAVSAAATAAAREGHCGSRDTAQLAVGGALVLGFGKEAYDKHGKRTFWSWKDIVWDLAGALAGYCAVEAAD